MKQTSTTSSSGQTSARESFQDDEWQVVNNKPSPANNASASSSSSNVVKKASIPSNLTPTQRKSLHKANKNPHKSSAKVTVEDDDKINEEDDDDDDDVSNSDDDDDDDVDAGSGNETPPSDIDSDGEGIRWTSKKQLAAKKAVTHHAANNTSQSTSQGWSMSSILMWVFMVGVVMGLIWIRFQDSAIWEGVDPDDIDITSKPPSEQQDHYHILQIPRNADLKQIKASYRKLVLATSVSTLEYFSSFYCSPSIAISSIPHMFLHFCYHLSMSLPVCIQSS